VVRSRISALICKLFGNRFYLALKYRNRPETSFLRKVHGVIHVGANVGQERFLYDAFDLEVLWIEPIPGIFEKLMNNIAPFPKQHAMNCLVTAEDDKEYQFHISNNEGESSSVLSLSKHKEIWPEVTYTKTIALSGVTLATLIARNRIDLAQFDALVLDTQGSEYEVLRGAISILGSVRFIKVEVPNFEAYEGCCRLEELTAFMSAHGFREVCRIPFSHKEGVGTYFDILYRRESQE